ncbi:methyltransferase [Pontibacillus halophilus JSM 076056 = DSM 19796]|uniref:Methyltransferase n=1 Tax=Pontibacillus halophilus JSM 076056 = DSM 19796 TaxID=1385510 RepID=A0A0A5GQQ8_9BACI|nr:class I SAM-dependent methyltransferase [Pontibacillus halophilus]KGX93558.1 methyltransferase [Pontibacillus halophilus JSM 076056 = DSM 19796]
MADAYGRFAEVYDDLMSDAPYEEWVSITEGVLSRKEGSTKDVIDLGCGTGEITLQLAKKGFTMTGVDLSEAMLTIAQQKATKARQSIQWVAQDITAINLEESHDLAISYCDVVNYLGTSEQIQSFFARVYELLRPGGTFIFDSHSISYVDEFLVGETFGFVSDETSYIWFCEEGEKPHQVVHDLTFFLKENHHYTRVDEQHVQQTHPIESYRDWLVRAGFSVEEIFGDFDYTREADETEQDRLFFVCHK